MSEIYDVAVIGVGAAGQMAMLRAVLNHLKVVAFMGNADSQRKSRSTWVDHIENTPGFSGRKRPILAATQETLKFIESRPDLAGCLSVVKNAVQKIRKENNLFYLSSGDQTYVSRYAILCTGTMDVQPEIGGTIKTVFPFATREEINYCIRCKGHNAFGKNVAVIGHSESAAHMAVVMHERYNPKSIAILTNAQPWKGTDETNRLLARYGIKVYEEKIEKILGDPHKALEGFLVGEKTIPAEIAFVALGVIVYHELAKQLGVKLDERGHLITDEEGQTSVEGFFAAGDLVSGAKKQVYTAWDRAVDAVDAIDYEIRMLKREGKYAGNETL